MRYRQRKWQQLKRTLGQLDNSTSKSINYKTVGYNF